MLELFRHQGVLYSTDRVVRNQHQQQVTVSSKDIKAVDKCIDLMTMLVLQSSDGFFLSKNQYTLACAVIAASRRHCRVTVPSLWPEEL